jgi:protein TonB
MHRHLFFFSASLALHALLVFSLLSVLVVVSDTPSSQPGGPLFLSLSGDETKEDIPVPGPVGGRPVVSTESPPPTKKTVSEPSGENGKKEGEAGPSDTGPAPDFRGFDGEGDASALADYIRAVRSGIERHKRYPLGAARIGIEGTVTVSFVLDERGNLLDRRVASGSGHPVLDEAALAAVGDSSPFPPFPEGIHRETLLFRLPIRYESR